LWPLVRGLGALKPLPPGPVRRLLPKDLAESAECPLRLAPLNRLSFSFETLDAAGRCFARGAQPARRKAYLVSVALSQRCRKLAQQGTGDKRRRRTLLKPPQRTLNFANQLIVLM